jgi:hypothetical protein
MHIDVFETTDPKQLKALKDLVAGDGKTISIDKIYTSSCGYTHGYYHYVTVTYHTLEQAPAI